MCNRLTREDIHVHVEKCLSRSTDKRPRPNNGSGQENGAIDDDSDDDEDSIDIVGDQHTGETYETYEWAGQTRIRTSSLLPGGYAGTGMGSNSTTNIAASASETEEVNVDGDDTQVFGQTQFSEKDIIQPANTAADKYLRSLVAGEAASSSRSVVTLPPTGKSPNENEDDSDASSSEGGGSCGESNGMQDQIVESLKARLKEYEQQSSASARNKCQICIEEYKSPCVSISCWHVLCEDCWLRSLGSCKLCPKCKMITSAADLRRIYL